MRDSGQLEGPLAAADLAPLLHPVTHPSRLSPCVTQALGEGAADSETPPSRQWGLRTEYWGPRA